MEGFERRKTGEMKGQEIERERERERKGGKQSEWKGLREGRQEG